MSKVLRDAEVYAPVTEASAPYRRHWDRAGYALVVGWGVEDRRLKTLLAALGHVLDFWTWRSLDMRPSSFCSEKRERRGAKIWRWKPPSQRPPPSPPTMSRVPRGVSVRRSRDNGRLPAVSRIRSNRRVPSVKSSLV